MIDKILCAQYETEALAVVAEDGDFVLDNNQQFCIYFDRQRAQKKRDEMQQNDNRTLALKKVRINGAKN